MPQQQRKWDDISVQEQLDVLVYDMIKGEHWDTLQSLEQNKEGLQDTLAQKKEIWDKNKLERSAQELYIETSTFYVRFDTKALEMRNSLLNLLKNSTKKIY